MGYNEPSLLLSLPATGCMHTGQTTLTHSLFTVSPDIQPQPRFMLCTGVAEWERESKWGWSCSTCTSLLETLLTEGMFYKAKT